MSDAASEPAHDGPATGEDAAVNDFLAMFLRDRAAGVVRALPWYQEQFAAHRERIAAEHEALVATGDPDAALPEIPQVRIEAEIGRGGQGVVYRGRQEFLERTVAVKVLHRATADATFARRFRREAKTLAGLAHANIVACHQAGVTDTGICWLVMEFVEGPSLRARLRSHGPLPAVAVVSLLRDLASALAHAQAAGFVHRDVKAENVLLQPMAAARPFPFRAKLADLGLARSLAVDPQLSGATPFGLILGTPVTMAPEQFDAPQSVDHRADIYALGCVAWLALTGEQPFAGQGMRQIMQQKERAVGPDPREVRPDVPAPLAQLVVRMMARDAAARPQSYEELQHVLSTCAPQGELVGPAGRGGGTRWFAVACVVALLATGLVYGIWPGRGDDVPVGVAKGDPVPGVAAPSPTPWRASALFSEGDDPFVAWSGDAMGGIDDESSAPTLASGRGAARMRRSLAPADFELRGELQPCRGNDNSPVARTSVACRFGPEAGLVVELVRDGNDFAAVVNAPGRPAVAVPGRWSRERPLPFTCRRVGPELTWSAGQGADVVAGTCGTGDVPAELEFAVDGGRALFPGFSLQVRP